MKFFTKSTRLLLALALLGLLFVPGVARSTAVTAQQPIYVGIPRERFEFVTAAQQNSQWCWAASIQMVLNYYGVNINQSQIVARTYGSGPMGQLPDWPGSFEAITRNLNNWSFDNNGTPYVVTATLGGGPPTPAILLEELNNQRPVILAYRSGPNSGHAVVVTAASFVPTMYGPMIQSIIVRDPYPTLANIQNRGRVEYPGAALAQVMTAYWYVRVNRR